MGHTQTPAMRRTGPLLLLAVSASCLPQPQLEALGSVLSSVFGTAEDLDSVPYTVLAKYDDYEVRQYPSVSWVCAEDTYTMEDESGGALAAFFTGARRDKNPNNKMFMKLFRYITGANNEEEEIEMTAPVKIRMKLLEGNMINKKMCFYIDQAHQARPPKPTDPEVSLYTNEEFTVYVHTFGGYSMSDSANMIEARKFAEVLDQTGLEVDTTMFFTAGYDSPMKFWNRRNEIWFLAP